MSSILVRYEGQQEDGFGNSFPLFTVMKKRTFKFKDGVNRVFYEPDTTIGTKGLQLRFKVFAPEELKYFSGLVGSIFELPL